MFMKNSRYYQEHLITDCLDGAVSVTWLGTAGLFISDGKSGFFIDPFVSRHSMSRVLGGRKLLSRSDLVAEWIDRCGGGSATAVLVSHSHFDHSLDAAAFAAQTGASLVGSESTAWIGRSDALPENQIQVVKAGDTITLGDFSITCIESLHGPAFLGRIPYPGEIDSVFEIPAPAGAYRLGTTFAFQINHAAGTMIHHGSAGYRDGMYDGISADIMFLGIGGRGDTARYLRAVVQNVSPTLLIPVHFDNFCQPLDKKMGFLPRIKMGEFFETAGALMPDMEVRTLPIGTPVALF